MSFSFSWLSFLHCELNLKPRQESIIWQHSPDRNATMKTYCPANIVEKRTSCLVCNIYLVNVLKAQFPPLTPLCSWVLHPCNVHCSQLERHHCQCRQFWEEFSTSEKLPFSLVLSLPKMPCCQHRRINRYNPGVVKWAWIFNNILLYKVS